MKCQALNSNGDQCKYIASRTVNYHGDHEIYYSYMDEKYPISWVKIKVCKHHFEEHFKR